ncbi:hypothetical protein Hanom_Chr01g00056661 [Helianthus anomalus]
MTFDHCHRWKFANLKHIFFRVNYIVSMCGLHKITYLGTNSLKSPSRVLTFHFVTF